MEGRKDGGKEGIWKDEGSDKVGKMDGMKRERTRINRRKKMK